MVVESRGRLNSCSSTGRCEPFQLNIITGLSIGSILPFIPGPRSSAVRSVSFSSRHECREMEGSAPLIKVGPLRAVTQPVRGSAPDLLMGVLQPLWVHVGLFCWRRSKTFSPSSGRLQFT